MFGLPEPGSPQGSGDDEVWAWIETLYRQQAQMLVRLAAASGLAEDAQGIVNDAFLRLEQRVRTKGWLDSNPVAYLVTIVQNEIRQQSRRAAAQLLPLEDFDRPDPFSQEVLEKVLARHDDQAKLTAAKQAVSMLPLYLRQVYVLCEMYGYPAAEVARATEIAPATVRNYLYVARQRVHAQVVDLLESGEGNA